MNEVVDKVKELTTRLDKGVEEILTSDRYKSYLKQMSKFHSYSFRNSLLILLQNENSTLVAGYKTWQNEFDRQVVPEGTAVASDVASGKTFMNNTGELITGTGTSYLNLLKNGGDETKYTKNISTVNSGTMTLTHDDTYLRIKGFGSSYQTAECWITINEAVDLTNINMILFDFYIFYT